MNEFLEQFLIEARELVEQATSDLLTLETSPSDHESLAAVFRAFHTLKGAAAIVDFAAMGRAANAVEDILAGVRRGERAIDADLIHDCLASLDQIVRWLDAIQDDGDLPDLSAAEADANRILARLLSASNGRAEVIALSVGAIEAESSSLPEAILTEQIRVLAKREPGSEGAVAAAGRVAANVLRHLGRLDAAKHIEAALSASLIRFDPASLIAAIERALTEITRNVPPTPATALPARSESRVRTLRVDAERIGALVDLAGELTAAKNSLDHLAKRASETRNPLAGALKEEVGRLHRLVDLLRREAIELRVLPLRTVFQKFPRLVRETSASIAKPIRLLTEGDDTEADKAIVEALFEPLLHLVRNAMDHGVESKSARAAAGKTPVATIVLRARRENDRVIVEVEDDGGGIDLEKIRDIALARGIATVEQVSAMRDEEAANLIFVPGLSTAAEISELSGRGVGMDAVRAAIERLGGRISLETRRGMGSAFRLELPFSVMVTRVMTVDVGGQLFGVPLDGVVETVRLQRRQIRAIGDAQVVVVRDRAVPLLRLGEALGRHSPQDTGEAFVVVVSAGDQLAALEVDRLGATMDVMLKPPNGLLSKVQKIAGTTMLGDGSVLLILDILSLVS